HEVFAPLPELASLPRAENESIFPAPGDVYLYRRLNGARRTGAPSRLAAIVPPGSNAHLAFWYGRDSLPMTATGRLPGSHVGEIVRGLDDLKQACERIRFEGVTAVRLSIEPVHEVGSPQPDGPWRNQ